MDHTKSKKLGSISIGLGGAFFLGLFILIVIGGKSSGDMSADDFELGFLAMSYQVIFLTTSLLGMLSDKSETIYWERFTEYVMVYPKVINFIGLSIAGYSSLLVQTICIFNPSWKLAFYISFSIGIAVIIILWWKMSSIFFRRDYFLEQLKKKELRKIKELFTKDDPEERIKVKNHLDSLRELTYFAVDNHNYRAISENCDYLIETVCCCEYLDAEIRSKSVDTIRLIIDYMYTHNEWERIKYLLTSNCELLTCRLQALYSLLADHPESADQILDSNIIVSYEIADWIIQDISRLGIWKTLRERIIDRRKLLYCFIKYFYTRYYPFSIVIEKGKEDDARSLQTQYDDVEKMIRLRKEYEKFIVKYATFALENDLAEELEVIIEFFVKEPDLIKACPKTNILLDPSGTDSSFDHIFNLIDEDDHLLSSFITAYSTVVFMAKYEDVVWDGERDEMIVDQIMTIYNKKTEHASALNALYETFMCEFVPASSETRKKYVERMLETKDYQKLKSIISYDNNVCDFIKNQIDDSSDSYYRIFLYLKGMDCSIVCPIESVCSPNQDTCAAGGAKEESVDGEDKNDTEMHDDPETVECIEMENDLTNNEQKDNVLENVKNDLIKMEFRPTGKNKDEMIDFWSDIRRKIPESESDVLGVLDDYISALTIDPECEAGN